MAIVGPHLAKPEGEAANDVVDEGDRIGLGVPAVDLERSERVASSMAVYW
jgi:hypothetical protein